MKARDTIRKMRLRGEIQDHHVVAAARFHKLVFSGHSSKSLNLEKVDGTPKNLFFHNMSGLILSRLSRQSSDILTSVVVYEESFIQLGYRLGAASKTSAYRRGYNELKKALDEASNALC